MLPFSAILLRDYYNAIGWNEDNQYTQLTRSSSCKHSALCQHLISHTRGSLRD
jgi:hypothetical protein